MSGPAVDALENRKEYDNGPTEDELTVQMSEWWTANGKEYCQRLKQALEEYDRQIRNPGQRKAVA
jgi:hypothetical protein